MNQECLLPDLTAPLSLSDAAGELKSTLIILLSRQDNLVLESVSAPQRG
jgi:hypothetical protein